MPISKKLAELDINKSKKRVLDKILKILEFQFSDPIFQELLQNEKAISIDFSKKTGKVKNLYYREQRILTYNPTIGQFNLSLEGAKILKNKSKPPNFRVKIMDEIQDFIKNGKSVFAKHILEIDKKKLRPGSEVLVVNESDELVAIGKLIIPPILHTGREVGVGVSIRKGNKK